MEEYEVRKARPGLRSQKLGRRWRCLRQWDYLGTGETSKQVQAATAEMQVVPIGGAVMLLVSWISSKGSPVRGQLRETAQTQLV